MFRLLKALPLASAIVAIVALGLFAASCNSSNHALVRVINAIPDASGPLDVYINGTNGTKIPALGFQAVYPTQQSNQSAVYNPVPSGNDTITAYVSGTTIDPVNNGSTSLGGSTQYTVILQGYAASNNAPSVLTDNNTAPASGYLQFRVINASPSWPSGSADIYIYEVGGGVPASPTIAGLTLGQGQYVPAISSFAGGFTVYVTAHGAGNNGIAYVNQNYTPATGSITTLVLVDNSSQNGGGPSAFPIDLTDLQ
ncbi:MAG TPA: DUF4397 domain-containing protein [Terriglobales bacterium]|nr:DUF4397 domain-containing protein [Terriglobales bacterium]